MLFCIYLFFCIIYYNYHVVFFVVFPGADLHGAFIWADIRGRTWEDPLHKKSMQVPGYEDMATSRRYTLVGPRTGGSHIPHLGLGGIQPGRQRNVVPHPGAHVDRVAACRTSVSRDTP